MRNDLTIVQSTITFLDVSGRPKRMTYSGPMHSTNVIIKELYPGATNKDGYQNVQNDLTKGEYDVLDIQSGNYDYHCISLNNPIFQSEF